MRRLSVHGSSGVRAAIFSTAWLFAFSSVPALAQASASRLVLRVYDAFGLTAADSAAAANSLQDVFAAADVKVLWRACHLDGPDPCSDRLAANELVIRLLPGPRDAQPGSAPTLGFSSIQTNQPAIMATIYPDRVRSLAQRAGRDGGALLGAAIAHEAGHLLLGTTGHPRTGLMRAQWTARSLGARHPTDGLFLPTERLQIRAAIATRARGRAPDGIRTAVLRLGAPQPNDR